MKLTSLIDDRKARSEAIRLQLDHVGTLGVVSYAKISGMIPLVAPTVAALRTAGIYYHQKIIDAFLQAHGEAP